MAVNQRHQVAPTVLLGEHLGHIDRPSAAYLERLALCPSPGADTIGALPTLPALSLDDPVDLFPVDIDLPFATEHRGNPPYPVLGEAFDDIPDGLDELSIQGSILLRLRLG